jgi:hypothetical protein
MPHTLYEFPRLRMTVSSRRPEYASPPTTRDPPGGVSWWFQRTTHRESARFRGGVSDPSQHEARSEASGGAGQAVPLCARDYTSSLKRQDYRCSTASRPTWVRCWHVSSKQILRPRPTLPWPTSKIATTLVEERRMASKSVASTSSRQSRSRSNRPAHSKLPTIQEEVNQPRANGMLGVDLRADLVKNRRGRDAHGYIDQCHREREERELRRRLDCDREYGPRAPSTGSWSARDATATTSRTGGVPSTRQTTAILRVWCPTWTIILDLRS